MAKKPTISEVSSGYTSTATLQANLEALRDAFDNTVSRDGSTPNTMNADLDLNSNDLLNVGELDISTLRIDGTAVIPADLVSVEQTYLNAMDLAYIYSTQALFLAGTETYTDFEEGDYVLGGPFLYIVAASDATDEHVTNAGGVNFYVVPQNNTVYLDAFNIDTIGTDVSTELETVLQWASDNDLEVIWNKDKTYEINEIDLTGSHKWTGANIYSSKSSVTGNNDFAISMDWNSIDTVNITADFSIGDSSITVDDASNIQAGDLIQVRVTRLIPAEHRNSWNEGQLMKVSSVSGNTVYFENTFVHGFVEAVHNGTITAISGDRYTVTLSNPPGDDAPKYVRKLLRITSGDAEGEERYIKSGSGSDMTHGDDWGGEAWPAGLQVGDSYTFEAVATARIFRPNTVVLKDFKLYRDRHYDAIDGDDGYGGIEIDGAFVIMKDVEVDGFSDTNIRWQVCYNPYIENADLRYANMAYGTGSGHGYGINVSGCHGATIVDVRGFRNRRTVDFSGGGNYSTNGKCVRVTNQGGGQCYTGDDFFPVGTVQLSVVGSHGSGHSTQYIDCEGTDVYYGIILRGQKEQVKGYRGWGSANQLVRMPQGGFGATITDIAYEDQFDMPGVSNWEREYYSDQRCQYCVYIIYDDIYTLAQPVVIRGVRANSVREATVFVEMRDFTEITNLHIYDTFVVCEPDSADATEDFRVLKFDENITIDNCTFNNNNFQQNGGYVGNSMGINMAPVTSGAQPWAEIADGGTVWINNKAWVRVTDQSVHRVRLRSGQGQLALNILNARTGGSRPRGYGIGIEDASSTDRNSSSAKTSLELIASYPTAYTDATSGYIALNLSRDEGVLSLASNLGSDQTLIIDGL